MIAWMISVLFTSAVFRALEQIMRWNREWQSWLPEWVFSWDLGFLSIADAVHVYMGIKLVGMFAGGILAGVNFWVVPANMPKSARWLLCAGIIIVYYQVFNLFYHVVFIEREFWRWPIFAM